MQTDTLLREDHHVHSTFSDGRSTLEENIAAGRASRPRSPGLRRPRSRRHDLPSRLCRGGPGAAAHDVGDAEHRHRSEDPRRRRPARSASARLETIDVIYVADHQFPWPGGPRSPRDVKADLDSGASAARCIETLVLATIAAMRRNRSHPLVLAHLFSILPKVGLSEDQVPDDAARRAGSGRRRHRHDRRDQRTMAVPVAADAARRCGLPAWRSSAAPTAISPPGSAATTTSARRCRRSRHDVLSLGQPRDPLPDPLDHGGTAQRRHRRLMISWRAAVALTALAVGGVLLPRGACARAISAPSASASSTLARCRSSRRSSSSSRSA